MITKLVPLLACLAVLFTAPTVANAAKLEDPKSKVSLELPQGWVKKEMPGFAMPMGFGPTKYKFTVNVNIVSEKFDGTADAYAAANIKTLESVMKGFKAVKQSTMKAKSGASLVVLEADTEMMMPMRQVFIFVKGMDGFCSVVTCSTAREGADEFTSVFMEIAKSIEVDGGSGEGGASDEA